MGKMSERMARVEEKVEATQKTVSTQMEHCHEIHQDLYEKVNPLPEKISTAKGTAEEANSRSKWLRAVLIGLIVSVALLGLKIAWDVVSALNAAE
jgi:UDP-N-acetyl-D-mannosaminuronate dehydrogenase